MDKRDYSERDVCTKLITPAILRAGWAQSQFREEVKLTDGRVIVRGQLAARVKNPDAKDFSSTMAVRVVTDKVDRRVSGTIIGKKMPRIIGIDDYELEMSP